MTNLSKKEDWVLQEFRDTDALLEGHFLLSSGLHSPVYLQCARVLMDPLRAERLVAAFLDKFNSQEIAVDAVISPAMGGVIVGYEVARQMQVTSLFTERVNGTMALRRGFSVSPGTRILMMEDVVTTGKSSRECIETISEAGGVVVAAGCLIDRSGGKADVGVPLTALRTIEAPTYTVDDIPPTLAAIPATKPGSRVMKVG